MKCRDCEREVPYAATGICAQCTPREVPKWGIFQDELCGYWLQWNGAIQIMEVTSEKRHAARWESEDTALQAAAYYELMFGRPLKVRRL